MEESLLPQPQIDKLDEELAMKSLREALPQHPPALKDKLDRRARIVADSRERLRIAAERGDHLAMRHERDFIDINQAGIEQTLNQYNRRQKKRRLSQNIGRFLHLKRPVE